MTCLNSALRHDRWKSLSAKLPQDVYLHAVREDSKTEFRRQFALLDKQPRASVVIATPWHS